MDSGSANIGSVMSKPIPDKAEVALEYPDKLYIGTFEQSSRFDAHLDKTGVSLTLHRTGEAEVRKSIRMHFHYGLFAEILADLARTVAAMPLADADHRIALRAATEDLHRALDTDANKVVAMNKPSRRTPKKAKEVASLTPQEEVLLLHVLE
jgi:hypothetical protein